MFTIILSKHNNLDSDLKITPSYKLLKHGKIWSRYNRRTTRKNGRINM